MSTPTISAMIARAALGAACLISSVSCGGELLRTGRSPSYIIVQTVRASKGNTPADLSSFLLSDVRADDGSVFNDNVTVTLQIAPKNPTVDTTTINSVTLSRYHVEYRRADGRNTPGVDVPYAFDGAVSGSLFQGGALDASFEVVRHQAKREPPLSNLTNGGGLRFLDVVAFITIYGRDQNGNELKVETQLDIHFADYGG